MNTNIQFPSLIQKYFVEHLIHQKKVSNNTISSYRDTFRLLFKYAKEKIKVKPSEITIDKLNATFICDFLAYLENERKVSIKTRNQRLSCIQSFFNYISVYAIEYSELIQQVIAIPKKKCEQRIVDYLNLHEYNALLSVQNMNNWIGIRDNTLIMLMTQTGLRVSEVVNLTIENIICERSKTYIKCYGKGRKEREIPLTNDMSNNLLNWIKARGERDNNILFISNRGKAMSVDAVQFLVKKYTSLAAEKCQSLKRKNITPHVLRHTTAIMLLQSGVDRSVIALWLGHEKFETTQIYLKADLTMKEEILKKYMPFGNCKKWRFKADDELLTFLNSL